MRALQLAEHFQIDDFSVLDKIRISQLVTVLKEALGAMPETEEGSPAAKAKPAKPAIEKTKPRVLLVDDDIDSINLAKYLLAKHSVEVEGEQDPVVALRKIEQGLRPNLIILDLMMHKMNGFEFLKQMRELKFLDSIPVVVASGRGFSVDRIRCLEDGASDYLEKPYNPEELYLRIKKILDSQKH